jgi:gamma-glutamylcyclotransferase (GGCT)/AIG2-like uncharacterized protein YtfP
MAGKNSKGKPKRGPGNPRILEQNEPYRFPAISPGEKSVTVSLRIPQSKLERVDILGKRADVIREAIDLLLTQSKAQATVWLLLENNPGVSNRVLGMFSSLALAMEAPRVKEMISSGTWEERVPGLLWICEPSGDEGSYFSVEGWQVGR